MEIREHDGCKGCRYVMIPEDSYPCCNCKQNYEDLYKSSQQHKFKKGDIVILPLGVKAIVLEVKGKQSHVLCKNMATYWIGEEAAIPTGLNTDIDKLFK